VTFRSSPPPAFTKDLVARFLSWHIQEQAFGGLDPEDIFCPCRHPLTCSVCNPGWKRSRGVAEKKFAGAALTSFREKSSSAKKLAGAAKTSRMKKCIFSAGCCKGLPVFDSGHNHWMFVICPQG
jgi:hypothetical protein